MDIQDAIGYIGTIDNASGQLCQMKDGRPHLLLFEFACANCSEVESRNADDMGEALMVIVNAAPALLARIARLEAAANAAYDVLAESMECDDYDYTPAPEVAHAFNLLYDVLAKAPPPDHPDPSGGDLSF